jgi:hypothetical protein
MGNGAEIVILDMTNLALRVHLCRARRLLEESTHLLFVAVSHSSCAMFALEHPV